MYPSIIHGHLCRVGFSDYVREVFQNLMFDLCLAFFVETILLASVTKHATNILVEVMSDEAYDVTRSALVSSCIEM